MFHESIDLANRFKTIVTLNCYLLSMQSLYNLGARNFMVAGLPPVGCLPVTKTLHLQQAPLVSGGCIERQNAAAERYNTKLKQMLTKLEAESPGSTFAYVDVYNPLKDMVNNPRKYGERTRKLN